MAQGSHCQGVAVQEGREVSSFWALGARLPGASPSPALAGPLVLSGLWQVMCAWACGPSGLCHGGDSHLVGGFTAIRVSPPYKQSDLKSEHLHRLS